MSNNMQATAKKLKKALKSEMTLVNAVKYAENIGYSVIFYDSIEDENLLRYNLSENAQQTTSFTYNEFAKIIFISNCLSHHEKLHRLLHELGHILLQHIGNGNLYLLDKDEAEAEAETFVYLLMYKKKTIYKQFIIIILIIFSLLLGMYIGYTAHPNVLPAYEEQTQENADMVYITPSGKKYHKANCIYTKDKDCTGLPRSEAEKNYSPCLVCNP